MIEAYLVIIILRLRLFRAVVSVVTLLTTGIALVLPTPALGFCYCCLGFASRFGTFFFPFFFAEEEEPFSITCKLFLWPMIPSAAWSSFNNSANE